MNTEYYYIDRIPAVLYGPPSKQGYLFVHGQGGSKEEAEAFAEIAVPAGYQVLGIDMPEHGARSQEHGGFNPMTVVPELQAAAANRKTCWKRLSLRANSIGAYFSMLAFFGRPIDKALFVSPIVDMERLILDMMSKAGVSEEQLRTKGELTIDSGQTLFWSYLSWVREHPILEWQTPTSILYAGRDNLTPRETVTDFAKAHGAALTIYEQGEHWFHTPEQCETLSKWEQQNI